MDGCVTIAQRESGLTAQMVLSTVEALFAIVMAAYAVRPPLPDDIRLLHLREYLISKNESKSVCIHPSTAVALLYVISICLMRCFVVASLCVYVCVCVCLCVCVSVVCFVLSLMLAGTRRQRVESLVRLQCSGNRCVCTSVNRGVC